MGKNLQQRRGEKLGWIGGWIGGFLWIALLGTIWLFQGKIAMGLTGLALTGLAVVAVLSSAPWRHPTTPYWRLLLPIYGVLFGCAAWTIWAWGGLAAARLPWWSCWWLLPLLSPLITVGKRCWQDGEPHQDPQAGMQQQPSETSP